MTDARLHELDLIADGDCNLGLQEALREIRFLRRQRDQLQEANNLEVEKRRKAEALLATHEDFRGAPPSKMTQ